MAEYIPGYKNLKVYAKANELVLVVYKITQKYPKEETFSLVSQMRRAAISAVANIVEGWARKSQKDKINFYHIARGSLAELGYYIELSFELKFINESELKNLEKLHSETSKLLRGFINSQES